MWWRMWWRIALIFCKWINWWIGNVIEKCVDFLWGNKLLSKECDWELCRIFLCGIKLMSKECEIFLCGIKLVSKECDGELCWFFVNELIGE
jgi:hypothetical protein